MASLKDIAEAADVSIRTVSRVLKSEGYVRDATRERVTRTAATLGYSANLAARSLRTGRSFEIAAVLGSMDELHMEKLLGFEQVMREAGYSVTILFGTAPELRGELDAVLGRRAAGAAIFPEVSLPTTETAHRCAAMNTPCVFFDVDDQARLDVVRINRQQGVREAVKYLAGCGRRRIAFVGPAVRGRLEGYRRAMRELERSEIVFPGREGADVEYRSGLAAAKAVLDLQPRPDAVQVYSDVMAMGVMAGLHESGVRIPDEIAVVGFDNRHMAAYAWPRLTTVAQPNRELGIRAARQLLSRLDDPASTRNLPWQCVLPTKLVLRDSA